MPTFQVYLNGRVQPLVEARIPVMDAGLLLGAGLFETLRAYDRFVFRLDDHLDRLLASARALEVPVAESREEIAAALACTIRENELEDARCRITLSRGPLPNEHLAEKPRPTCLIVADRMTPYPQELYDGGMTVTISEARVNEKDPACGHKTVNYLSNLLVLRDAHAKGAQEALRFNGPGRLVGGCISNVFTVRDGKLTTPPTSEGCLPGVTRKVVLELAAREGVETIEEPIDPQGLLEVDEMFLTNSIMEVMPVCRVERHELAGGEPGPMTRRLMVLYKKQIEKEEAEAAG